MKKAIVSFILIVIYTTVIAQLKFAESFTKEMVLQRDMPVKIWGSADKNEAVQVEIQEKIYFTKADKSGAWIITTESLKAGGPYQLSLKGEKNSCVIQQVYVGEVWIAGGQSNMEFDLSRSTDGKKHIEKATNENIRFIYVPRPDKVNTPEDNELIWKTATTNNIGEMSAVAYHFAAKIQPEINVPIGIICCYRGGSSAESWIHPDDLSAHPQLKSIIDFTPAKREEGSNQRRRSTLYEDMLTRVIPFTARGVIWYQGEANASRAEQYKILFPHLIASWRKYFDQPELSFYFVQLPKFGMKGEKNQLWAELREAQLETLNNVANTGMVVSLDCGEEEQLHPKNKQPVGERLAYIALNKNYGKDIAFSGPMYTGFNTKQNKMILSFDYAGKGLMVPEGEILKGFEISADGKNFVTANASIEKDKVIVFSDEIKKPITVRYGWSNCPDANLYNKNGLMASPFRIKH